MSANAASQLGTVLTENIIQRIKWCLIQSTHPYLKMQI